MGKRTLFLLWAFALVTAACTRGAAPPGTTAAQEPATTLAAPTTAAAPTETTETTEAGAQPAGETLAAVQDRGELRCGVNEAVPGFGFLNPEGQFEGFDIDFCKAVAAAVLGDPEAVTYVSLTAEQRFTALQAGEIDVLIRNTTWTATRDGTEGATFLTTTFYDGQGMMVRSESEFETLEDMADTTICVLSGTTTELNLNTRFQAGGIPFTPLTFEENATLQEAFVAQRCDGWTSDKSQLAGVRSAFPDEEGGPEALRILEETFSKEPLGPVVRDGDSEWAQVIDWVVLAIIQAEEFGITSANVDQMASDPEGPNQAAFLGVAFQPEEGEEVAPFEAGLGFGSTTWIQDVIRAVGNYGEIYERHIGPDTPLGLERGVNALWTEGGLHYPPPYR
ncbi:MAG: amino acid ABC transporter substrate-binding protein [Acidimicrobiia bacterium]